MADESRWNDQHNPDQSGRDASERDWGDRYRRNDSQQRSDDRRYGGGDFEQSRYGRYYEEQAYRPEAGGWRAYDPGHDSDAWRDQRGGGRGWERTAADQGYGQHAGDTRREAARDFAGWDAPFGGRPVDRDADRDRRDPGGATFDRLRSEGRSFLDRTKEELASLFGTGPRREDDRNDEGRRSAATNRYGTPAREDFRGRGPRNYRRSDERIRDDVNDRLTEDPHIDASGVEVHVLQGEVTLNGTVSSRADKRHAEDIVERISGVGHVQNNLRVDDGSGARRSYDEPSSMI